MIEKIKWIYTFGVDSEHSGEYVSVNTANIDIMREKIYKMFGQENIAGEYVFDVENFEKLVGYELCKKFSSQITFGEDVVKKYGLKEIKII